MHIQGEDRFQSVMFPGVLEDYVPGWKQKPTEIWKSYGFSENYIPILKP